MSTTGFFDEVLVNMTRLHLGRKCIGVSWGSILDKNEELNTMYPGKPDVVDCFLCKLIIEHQNSQFDKVVPLIEEPTSENKEVLTDTKVLKIENKSENEKKYIEPMYTDSYWFRDYKTQMRMDLEDVAVVEEVNMPNWQKCQKFPERFKEYEIDISGLLEKLHPKVAKKVMAMCAGFKGDIFKKYTNWYSLGHFYHEKERNIITVKILIGDDVEEKINQVYHALRKNIKHNIKKYFDKRNK